MSQLDRYLAHVDGVTGYRRSLARAAKIPGFGEELLGARALEHARGADSKIEWGAATAAGAIAGGIIGAKHGHPLLGVISGASVFTNAPALLDARARGEAFWNLAQTHGGVVGSLMLPDNKVLGFVLGYLAVGAARYFYKGDGA